MLGEFIQPALGFLVHGVAAALESSEVVMSGKRIQGINYS
jgi:hypothetical protein